MSVRRAAYLATASRQGGMALQFASSLVIARLLTPDEIGTFAVGFALIAILQTVTGFGLTAFIVQSALMDRARLRSAMGAAMAVTWTAAALLVAASGAVASFYDNPGVAEVVRVIALSFLLAPFAVPAQGMLQRRMAFGLIMLAELASAAAMVATNITLALLDFGPLALAWGAVAGSAAMLLVLAAVDRRSVLMLPGWSRWREIAPFSGYASGSDFLIVLGLHLPELIMGRLLGFDAVAFYNRARGLVGMFRHIAMAPLARVALPAFAASRRRGGDLGGEYLRSTALMAALAWPFYGTLAVVAGPAIRLLFGDQWDQSVPVLQLICVANLFFVPTLLSGQLFIAMGEIRLNFRREVWVQALRLTLVVAASFEGLLAVAASQILVQLFALGLSLHYLRRLTGMTAAGLLRSLAGSALVSALAVGAASLVAHSGLASAWPAAAFLAATGAAAVAVWLAAIFAFRHPAGTEVLVALSALRHGLARRRPVPRS